MLILMRNISIISFLILIISCKSIDYSQNINSTKSTYNKNYFTDKNIDYTYKSTITINKNLISCLIVIKRIEDNQHRIAMVTDFGNKLLDVTFENEKPKINYVTKDLDKKIILNPLLSDFHFLVKKEFEIENIQTENQYHIYNSKLKKYNLNIKENDYQVIFTIKDKIEIKSLKNENKFIFYHQNFPLEIEMQSITKN